MSGLTVVLGILSTIFITFLFIKWILQKRGKRYPRGPIGLPIVGHLPFFGSHPPSTFMQWGSYYGDVFSMRLGSWHAVVVNGYKAVKAAAEHPGDAFSGRPNFVSNEILAERINEDVFAFGNFSPVYLKQRKLTSKALRLFTSKRTDVIEELISNEACAFADSLIRKYAIIPGYIELDVQTLVTRIIYQFLYGRGKPVDVERHVNIICKSLEEFNEFTGTAIDVLPWLRHILPWKIDELRKIIAKSDVIMTEQVQEHYESFSADNVRDVADAIIASDVEDEENRDRYVLTRARLNLTLAELQGAGEFMMPRGTVTEHDLADCWVKVNLKSNTQKDGCSCGVFVLMKAECIVNGKDPILMGQARTAPFREYVKRRPMQNKLMCWSVLQEAKRTIKLGAV